MKLFGNSGGSLKHHQPKCKKKMIIDSKPPFFGSFPSVHELPRELQSLTYSLPFTEAPLSGIRIDFSISWNSRNSGQRFPRNFSENKKKQRWLPSWWLNQPMWKICSANWESTPNRGENFKNFRNHHLVTPWKINMEPENKGLVQMIFLLADFFFDFCSSSGVYPSLKITWPPKGKNRLPIILFQSFCC